MPQAILHIVWAKRPDYIPEDAPLAPVKRRVFHRQQSADIAPTDIAKEAIHLSQAKNTRHPQAAAEAQRLLRRLALGGVSATDPQGSYTGRPKKGEQPVQDADDL